jgi:molecular chaperone GrpE
MSGWPYSPIDRHYTGEAVRVPVRTMDENPASSSPDDPDVYREKYARLLAELDNHKKRAQRLVSLQQEQEKEDLFRALLPVVDNMERVLAHKSETGRETALLRGVELTLQSMHDALGRFGVLALEAEGEPFDPQVHEAVAVMSHPFLPPSTVAEVEQRGYLMHGRLLRPAKVVVTGS